MEIKNLKKLNEKDLEIVQKALQYYNEHLADIIRTRLMWKWEDFKDSKLNGFEKQEDFMKWKEDMNNSTKTEMVEIEQLNEKIEDILYGE